MAIRLCKSAINAADDGHAGLQVPTGKRKNGKENNS